MDTFGHDIDKLDVGDRIGYYLPNKTVNAPTIAEVVMWLYEKHGIWVHVDSHEFSKWCYHYRYNRPHELSSKITENGQFGLDDFNTPTEAYEAAIEYVLNNLI